MPRKRKLTEDAPPGALPEPAPEEKPAAPGELIGNIAEASRNTRSIYILFTGLLAYCAITIFGTSDRQIVLNEPTTLPVINVKVSLIGFFILAPLLSIFFFIYFQLYLHKLKRLLDTLRTKYQPVAEDERIYPWMLNFAGELGGGFVARSQRFIVNFSVWWSLPLVLMIFSSWYLKTHDPRWGSVIGLAPLFGTAAVMAFWIHYHVSSRERFRFTFPQFRDFLKSHKDARALLALVLLYEILFFAVFMPRALRGDRLIGTWPAINLSHQNLVVKEDKELRYWINLRNAELQGADLTGAILRKADFRGANLEGAKLVEAHLEGADLSGAFLRNADLKGVYLSEAVLHKTNFFDAIIQNADLKKAQLQGANFRGARMESADLYQVQHDTLTDFRGTVLVDAKAVPEEVKNAKFLKSPGLRYIPVDSLPVDSVAAMLTRHDFYSKKYGWNEGFNNPDVKGFPNGFELQQNGKVVVDTISGLNWQQSGSGGMDYEKAKAYIKHLNADRFAGFNDWRLPTLEEAMTLMEPQESGGLYIDPVFDRSQRWIWTADQESASVAWVVNFSHGYCYSNFSRYGYFYVRAVRFGH